jgi:hypothetical protein
MGCLQSSSFMVLINFSPSFFWGGVTRIKTSLSLSPFLFLLVTEGLSRLMMRARNTGAISRVRVSREQSLTHLQFIDNVLLMGAVVKGEMEAFMNVIDLFYQATRMIVNESKSIALVNDLGSDRIETITNQIPRIPPKACLLQV